MALISCCIGGLLSLLGLGTGIAALVLAIVAQSACTKGNLADAVSKANLSKILNIASSVLIVLSVVIGLLWFGYSFSSTS